MRKEFKIKLNDGKEYLFTERNKEDVDYSHYQEACREAAFRRIKDFQDKKIVSDQMADDLRYVEFGRIYTDQQIAIFLSANDDEIKKLVYSSFKINNEKISLEDFKKLVSGALARKLLNDINEIERGEPMADKDCAVALGLRIEKFKVLAKTQPDVYNYLKYNLKKSPGKE